MEQTAIEDLPHIAALLKVRAEAIVESLWGSVQSVEGLAESPDRWLTVSVRVKALGQLHVYWGVYVGRDEGAIDVQSTKVESMLSCQGEHHIDGFVVHRGTKQVAGRVGSLCVTQGYEACLTLEELPRRGPLRL